jgi:hypothetical protein
MRETVLAAGVVLVLLSQPAASQALGTAPVNAAFAQANAALGQVNATLGSLGITPGVGSVGTGVSAPAAVAVPAATGAAGGGGPSALGAGSASSVPATAATSFVSASAAALPVSLRPVQLGNERSTVYWSDIGVLTETNAGLQALRAPVRNRQGGTVPGIVQSCRSAVAASAIPYGAVGLDTVAAGPVRSTSAGYRVTIAARVLYPRNAGSQVRQATFTCQINRAGQVIAMR